MDVFCDESRDLFLARLVAHAKRGSRALEHEDEGLIAAFRLAERLNGASGQ